jgi:hypothetical protein
MGGRTMAQEASGGEVSPRVFFNTNRIVSHQWGWQVNAGDTRVEELSKEILEEA